ATIHLDPEEAGDEPFLLARRLPGVPVLVGSNRHDAARLAIEKFGVTAIVLDDGFQHRTLTKDLEIVMARAQRPWGNGRLLPAGPLREPLTSLARADLIVVTGQPGADALITTEKDWVRLRRLRLPRRPLYVLSIRLALQSGEPAWRQAFHRACP